MPDPNAYQSWLAQRRRLEPPTHLVDAVMARVTAEHAAEASRPSPPAAVDRVHAALEWISHRPWLQAACVAGGAAAGALRLAALVHFLLSY